MSGKKLVVFNVLMKSFRFWCSLVVMLCVIFAIAVLPIFLYFSKDLPDYQQLLQYDPPTISRIYTAEGDLISELAVEKRIFKSINEIPDVVKNAFIAAEDRNYFHHSGIDLLSIVRAAIQNIANIGSDRNPVGGSTITQQVVKNFLLTNERSISRKIKEAILAYRITKVYSKERVLELYLNQIYLGNSSYGVTSAALGYFNKDLKELSIDEAALLAALPKAPSLLDPTKYSTKAKARRDWVLERMYDEDFIKYDQYMAAKAKPINLSSRYDFDLVDNGYYNESVRLELIDKYGFDYVYKEGISVFTNLDKDLQKYADDALRLGLIEYDRAHGYKGPITKIKFKGEEWKQLLAKVHHPDSVSTSRIAVVLDVNAHMAKLGFLDGSLGEILLENIKWARKRVNGYASGKAIASAADVFAIGDVILTGTNAKHEITLEQIPDVNGALVAIQPYTGKVLALSGGYSFRESKYNRAIQAMRQPGSAFKPFVYLAALENGYGPTSIVKDQPLSISQGPGMPDWTPKNYGGKFLGDITMRKALEQSKNLATVYLITKVGTKKVGEVAVRLGVYDKIPNTYYSMALGAVETTPLKLTAAYAAFASQGKFITPKLIDYVEDRKGNVIFSSDDRICQNCNDSTSDDAQSEASATPELQFPAKYVIDAASNYQLVSMLQGVIDRGTAVRARSLGKVLAGKTGTSNDSNDTWFIGFSNDLVVGVFVGYDAPRSLGAKAQGANVALPIFIKFMEKALKDIPNKAFPVPEGITFQDYNYDSGSDEGIFGKSISEPLKVNSSIIDDAKNYGGDSSESETESGADD